MNVGDVMTRSVRTCRAGDSLDAAARIMWDQDCGCVPVVQEEDGVVRCVGMITDRDVCMAGYTQGLRLSEIPVESAMAKRVHACHATDSILAALRMLEDRQVRRLPVLGADDELVGIVSLADVAREASREHAQAKKHVTDTQVAAALEAISAPRCETFVAA
jgi:CBS domain-containing protein